MKRITLIVLLLAFAVSSNAQLGRLANKVKNKVTQRADTKADKAIDKTLDAIEGKGSTSPVAETEAGTIPVKDTTGISQRPASYSRYDFIPGEKILYAEDFMSEAIGELPAGWNTNGSGEVVSLQNQPGQWLRLHKSFLYLTSNTKETGNDYTLEFDIVLDLNNNGWMFPTIHFGVLASGALSTTDNLLLKDYSINASLAAGIHPGIGVSRLTLESALQGSNYFTAGVKEYNELENYYRHPVHVALQVQQERCRVWINGVKAFDSPKVLPLTHKMNQLFFRVGNTNYAEAQYAIYISNIRLATGLPDTRHQLITEGTFSTTGILFDVNAATIKPESYGVIREIARLLKENPSVKIRITGHTSSDGDDKTNMDLSIRRAAAVKQALVQEFSIDPAMIETTGKGETRPAADNSTKEGRTANRRVEFTRI